MAAFLSRDLNDGELGVFGTFSQIPWAAASWRGQGTRQPVVHLRPVGRHQFQSAQADVGGGRQPACTWAPRAASPWTRHGHAGQPDFIDFGFYGGFQIDRYGNLNMPTSAPRRNRSSAGRARSGPWRPPGSTGSTFSRMPTLRGCSWRRSTFISGRDSSTSRRQEESRQSERSEGPVHRHSHLRVRFRRGIEAGAPEIGASRPHGGGSQVQEPASSRSSRRGWRRPNRPPWRNWHSCGRSIPTDHAAALLAPVQFRHASATGASTDPEKIADKYTRILTSSPLHGSRSAVRGA